MTTSSRYNPFNSANVTTITSYLPSRNHHDMEAEGHWSVWTLRFTNLSVPKQRALRNVFPVRKMDALHAHQYDSVGKATTQGNVRRWRHWLGSQWRHPNFTGSRRDRQTPCISPKIRLRTILYKVPVITYRMIWKRHKQCGSRSWPYWQPTQIMCSLTSVT